MKNDNEFSVSKTVFTNKQATRYMLIQLRLLPLIWAKEYALHHDLLPGQRNFHDGYPALKDLVSDLLLLTTFGVAVEKPLGQLGWESRNRNHNFRMIINWKFLQIVTGPEFTQLNCNFKCKPIETAISLP